jgi:hypothetical protein
MVIAQQPVYNFGIHYSSGNRIFTAVDAQSNFYTGNSFSGTINLEPSSNTYIYNSNGNGDIVVTKHNLSGSIQWVRIISGELGDLARDMEMDSQGNIYIAALTASNTIDLGNAGILTTNGGGGLIVKISPSGTILWGKILQKPTPSATGSANGWGVAIDRNDNVILTGSFSGTIDFDPSSNQLLKTAIGGQDFYVTKFNSNGVMLWTQTFGGSGTENGFKVFCDNNNNVICSGQFSSTSIDFDPSNGVAIRNLIATGGNADGYLLKLDTNGNFVWVNQFPYVGIVKLATDTQGNIYGNGFFTGTTDFDPSNGAFNVTPTGLSDTFTLKINSDGNFSWVKTIGASSEFSQGHGVAVDIYGNVYSVGMFGGTNVDFDNGPNTFNLTCIGGRDYFIQKLDTNGNFIWAGSGGSTSDDRAWDLTVDGLGKIYIAGNNANTGDINPTSGTDNRTNSHYFLSVLTNPSNNAVVNSNTIASAFPLNDNGNNTPIALQNSNGLLATVTPEGQERVTGEIVSKIWINTGGSSNYLNKNIEISPQTNPTTSTGKITLYFAQTEFDTYNSTSTIDLPSNPTDAIGKANLIIDKYSGTSSDNSGTPISYGTTPAVINPDDNDIVWNATLNRWEVSFIVNGFSGFFLKGEITCASNLNLISTINDISNGIVIKEARSTTGSIVATNKITGSSNVTYRAGVINLDAGFKADSGTVFKAEQGGCN